MGRFFKCTHCKSMFSTRETLNQHYKFNHTNFTGLKKTYMWKYCSRQIQKGLHKSNKNAETRNKSSDETNNYQQTVERNRSHHLCIICKQTFESKSDLEKHFPTCGSQNTRNISKKVDKLKSQDCMIDTSIQDNCVGTKMLRSNEQSQVKTDKLNCEVCHKSFHSTENLTIHMNTCKKINLPCERCRKSGNHGSSTKTT